MQNRIKKTVHDILDNPGRRPVFRELGAFDFGHASH